MSWINALKNTPTERGEYLCVVLEPYSGNIPKIMVISYDRFWVNSSANSMRLSNEMDWIEPDSENFGIRFQWIRKEKIILWRGIPPLPSLDTIEE